MSTSSYDAETLARRGNGQSSVGADSNDFGRSADARTDGRGDRSAGALLRQLATDIAVLFRKELALAAAEVGESVNEAKKGATSMVTGGAVLYAGILFLLGAIAAFLATLMATWAAVAIVGAVTTVVGLIMVFAGKKKVQASSFAPNRTVDSLAKDAQTIRRQVQ
jgi:UPF0716 family protein affecting phage T7 exclusion